MKKEDEKARENDEYNLHGKSWRDDSKSGIAEAGGSDSGSVGDEKEELSDEPQESDVLQSVDFMQSDAAPVTDREERTGDDGAARGADEETGEPHGRADNRHPFHRSFCFPQDHWKEEARYHLSKYPRPLRSYCTYL